MSDIHKVKTRFAPSPTGFLHLGGARTAIFSWAFAKHNNGTFVLRIEDTDLERSTPEAVQAILDGMEWLGIDYDEGPYYQTKRFDRYKEVIEELIKKGLAYYCYSTPEEVEKMREEARAKGLKPKYDGTWRPEEGKALPPVPEGIEPVVRFKNPLTGSVSWSDMFKGEISISNDELDDLIIARKDGTPTYNFCVVVDDYDVGITHVIRGDDHVNNTPRQINILKAMGAQVPEYGHVPMILDQDGKKLSKRYNAVSVMEYKKLGYLPEALFNYLVRLGWSHGDDEIFSKQNVIDWFDINHLSKSASQWDVAKLNWVNGQYIKNTPTSELVDLVKPFIEEMGGNINQSNIDAVIELNKDRAQTLVELAQACLLFCKSEYSIPDDLRQKHLDEKSISNVRSFLNSASELSDEEWTAEFLGQLIKSKLEELQIKMPALGIPIRVMLFGQKQTPALEQVLAILGKNEVLKRLNNYL
ncbi:glutamate--tRNA ligase [Taylorella equigenitalis]|uniref:glutamate--tRNA ligase n=1 Tax=Taylorella equigenitalis TaxID=29575 RepID=UPI0023B0B8AE|nr:glutamate--tRNA ligase [Taylorella equigenitalis]WEE00224.1 glutamate--tRNA ligase [Taylorella equigenitalis]WFD78238.1 glutamate--tRNA ligase [Taylorella equigenitalis]WFD79716.1 glutamate--tRNA ligase [Taylorella equigenitalis]WFD99610.1 glutamate--tRNA ligase [Taylorella equigenitalis]WFE01089.1 glutamate--tRNA ligase [Taylorella equigenitalis]